jgi:hypothetical protein
VPNRSQLFEHRQAAQITAAALILAVLVAAVVLPRVHSGFPNASAEPAIPAVGAIQDPSTTPGVAATSTTAAMPSDSSACQTIMGEALRIGPPVEATSALSDAVVSGSIVAVGAARFGTSDGSKPTKVPETSDVYRVVTISVEMVGKTDSASVGRAVAGQQLHVRIFGGTVGCSTYMLSGQPAATVGQSAVWFLMAGSQPPLAAAPPADFDVIDYWSITNGAVLLPDGSQMSLSALLSDSLTP